MPTAHINGVELYYEQHGEGPPLVMIMGLRRNADWWWKQLPDFSKHFQVTVFDNRGSGRSDKPDMEYSIGLMAADTAGLMDHLGIATADVLGYSMGGYIAQELALGHPQKVQRLILVSTGAGGDSAVLMDPERQKEFTDTVGLTPEQVLHKNLDIYFSPGFIEKHPEEVAEFIRVSLLNPQPDKDTNWARGCPRATRRSWTPPWPLPSSRIFCCWTSPPAGWPRPRSSR